MLVSVLRYTLDPHFKLRITVAVSQPLLQRHSFYAAFAGRGIVLLTT